MSIWTYKNNLKSNLGIKALEYLKSRNIDENIIKDIIDNKLKTRRNKKSSDFNLINTFIFFFWFYKYYHFGLSLFSFFTFNAISEFHVGWPKGMLNKWGRNERKQSVANDSPSRKWNSREERKK